MVDTRTRREAELGAHHRDQGPDVLPAEAVPVDTHDVAVVRSAGLRPGGAHRHQARQLCDRGVQPARVALVAMYFSREVWFPMVTSDEVSRLGTALAP